MLDRVEVIQTIIDRIKAKTYLEIGVEGGHTFLRINARKKIAVDPEFKIRRKKRLKSIFKNPSNLCNAYYQMESDTFFETKPNKLARCGLDVAFIDGLHTYEQSLRDVQNTLKFLNKKGVIVMHDCNPSCEVAAYSVSSFNEAESLNLNGWTGQWCGDVWKTICYLRSTQNKLRICVLDCDCGLGLITVGTPENRLSYSEQDICNLTYDNLNENRAEILNLKNPGFLEEFIRSI